MDASHSPLEVFLFITTLLGFIHPIVLESAGSSLFIVQCQGIEYSVFVLAPTSYTFSAHCSLLTELNSGSMFEAVTLQDKWLVSSRPGHEGP